MQPWALAAEVAATLALVVVSAKAHGRQIRLEREQHGVWKVNFGAQNDPWVEALWRRDRIWFWSLFPIYLAASAALVAFWIKADGPALVIWLAVAAGWALSGCFISLGLASSARLLRAMKQGVPSDEWRRTGRRGSMQWWGLVALAAAASIAGLAL